MEVLIDPLDLRLRADDGANLLETLRTNAVPISYSCMAGRCGTCTCSIISGTVAVETSDDDKRSIAGPGDTILACRAHLLEDCRIEIPDVDEVVVHPARIIKGTVTAIDALTHDITGIRIKLAKPLDFSAGQYANLQFAPEHVRPYSMAVAAAPDNELEFHIRAVDGGKVTAYVANQLKVGDAVRVSGPLGTAYLRRKSTGPIICVAGGTGLAPILSIVRGALQAELSNPIHIYFGARSERDVYGLPWLEELRRRHPALHVHVVVSTGDVSEAFRSGLVTDAVDQDWTDMTDCTAYLAGAPVMVEAATALLQRKGLERKRIHADAFYPAVA